ncbi:hypothetical protein Hanom_Chr11g01044341 [Helianthus anomalus]
MVILHILFTLMIFHLYKAINHPCRHVAVFGFSFHYLSVFDSGSSHLDVIFII